MKILRTLGIGLALVLAVLVLGAYLLPGRIKVERSLAMQAPPEAVYAQVNELRNWPEWTTWNQKNYPQMKFEYEAQTSGAGARYRWTDPSGNGWLRINRSDLQSGVAYDLAFDGETVVPGSLTWKPQGEGLLVTWNFEFESGLNPLNRYFAYFALDGLIGKDFDTGLAQLKSRVEQPAAAN